MEKAAGDVTGGVNMTDTWWQGGEGGEQVNFHQGHLSIQFPGENVSSTLKWLEKL